MLSALIFLGFALCASPNVAKACDCIRRDLAYFYATDAVIILGSVIDRETVDARLYGNSTLYPATRVRVVVEQTWKGAVAGDTIPIATGIGGGDCGFPFEVGRRYLIFGDTVADGITYTNICRPTKPAELAHGDIAWLNGDRQRPKGVY